MAQQPYSILTVGSLAFDSVQTPTGKADRILGGAANHFSVAASFYAPVSVVGIVGQDFPEAHLEWLAARKVDVSGVRIVPGKSFHWVGSYTYDLNEATTLSTALNVFEHFDPELSEQHRGAQYVFLANIDPVLQLSVLDQVRSPKLVACDTMNFWITGKPEEVRKILKRIDILSINEGEAFLLTGEKNSLSAAEMIQKMGPSVVIIKRGEYGAMLLNGENVFIAPSFPVRQVIDPTGAGDSFAGAFMGFLAEARVDRDMARTDPKAWDMLLRRAVLNGCVMASFIVEDFGFHRLTRLNQHELVARQKSLLRMTSLEPVDL